MQFYTGALTVVTKKKKGRKRQRGGPSKKVPHRQGWADLLQVGFSATTLRAAINSPAMRKYGLTDEGSKDKNMQAILARCHCEVPL